MSFEALTVIIWRPSSRLLSQDPGDEDASAGIDTGFSTCLNLSASWVTSPQERVKGCAADLATSPLWALWRIFNDPPFSVFTMELFALANHRAELRAELAYYAERFRAAQTETFAKVLKEYGVDTDRLPPVAAAFLRTGVPGVLFMEHAVGIRAGHAEIVQLIERYLRELEGEPLV